MKKAVQINIFFILLIATTINARNSSIKLDSWMKHLPQNIKNMPLCDLAIPGSHDSMTFSISGTSKTGPDAEIAIRFTFASYVGPYIAAKWAKTQNLNTMDQLKAGIRYLDLRVATKPSTTDFYYTHGLYAGEISSSLNHIIEFVDSHPEEVVIMYFQHFYGFKNEDHTRLKKKLSDLFLTRLVPQPFSMEEITINNLARLNQSVIIIYNNDAVQGHPNLWSPNMLGSPWPQKETTEDLLAYFWGTLKPRGILFAHQAVLTPSGPFIVVRVHKSLLEECAEPVLRDVLPVIESEFFPGRVKRNTRPLINVVIADFIDLEHNLFPLTIIGMNKKLEELKEA